MKHVIEVKNLVKKFGKLTAIDGISFDVRQGEILALLGPNGAGKTTTLEILEGLTRRTGGDVKVLGHDPESHSNHIKEKIGVQLQSSAYYDYLSLKELLELFGSMYHREVNSVELLKKVNLEEKARARISQLSGGQKQRFAIVAAMVNDPEIVFLDEPTTGLDPQARRNLWHVISDIKKSGKTVILTTHYMEEAQVLADRILIVDHGKVIAAGSAAQLIKKLPNPYCIAVSADQCLDDKTVLAIDGVLSIRHEENESSGHRCVIGVKTVQKVLPALLDTMKKHKIGFHDLEIMPSSLEDVFLILTGEELRD